LCQLWPNFPVPNLEVALAHYRSLGSTIEESDDYGFANRNGVELHISVRRASAYPYVRDADALFDEWSRPDILGHSHGVDATSYGLREASHADSDGNLIRFGSPIED
jgi:hypothetical protein